MLKNIYIHIGNFATNFALRRFCRQHETLLAKNNTHYIALHDLFPELPDFTHTPAWYHELWIHEKIKKHFANITFPTEQEINAQLEKFIRHNKTENIILILQGNLLPNYFPALLLLKKTFTTAQFHIEENSIVLERELECAYNVNLLDLRGFILKLNDYNSLAFINSLNLKVTYSKHSSSLQSLLNASTAQHVFSHEIDCLKQFLTFIHIPCSHDYFFPNTFHPKILAFIIALKECISNDFINFYNENKLLEYQQKENNLFTYCHEIDVKEIKNFERNATPPVTNTAVHYTDCRDSSLRIDFKNACEIAKLLSPIMRQFLLKNVDNEYVPYLPYSSKIAYAALLLAEHMIDEKKAKELLQTTKGRINTGTEKYSKNPLLTVYTPTYNHKEYIKQCIESILAQKTKYPFKHLIIDDASTDGTQEILKKYAQKYEHIELILHKKNNMQLAFHHFPQNAATKYVAWCDGDDFYLDEHKLEEQIELMENNPDYGLCFHRTYHLYEDEHCIKKIHPQDSMLPNGVQKYYLPQDIIVTNLLQSSSAMYRWLYADSLPCHAAINVSPMDWALNILHAHKNKIGFINKPMSIYRRHKKAYYYETEVNIAKHVIKGCPREIKFCTTIDKATNYQYHDLFLKKMAIILDTFYNDIDIVDFDKEQYSKIKHDLEERFPHIIKEVKVFLNKYDQQ